MASRSPASSRRFALASALLGSLFVAASAGAQERSPVLTGVVRASVTHRSGDAPGLIVTSLDVRLVTCVGAAPCEAQVRVTVPGGRLGELEQRVEHHPVPAVGETLGLAQRRGRWVVYRLADRDEAQRFEALCSGSAAPQAGRGAPGARAQPSAVAR
ncbi:MAG: hypothetical protein INH37_20140 [Myxococcaceae bacterium]|nr:hypothetical protein [Myxococcaceae bacterium]